MGRKKDDDFLIKPGSGGRQADSAGGRQASLSLRTPRAPSKGALCHFRVTSGSRAKGQSAKAKVEYIARAGKYGRQEDEALHVESKNMPDWVDTEKDPTGKALWSAADELERANGRLYQEFEFALPRALTEDQNLKLAQDFAARVTRVEGGKLPYTMAIHAGKGTNPHVHLVVSERVNDGIGRTPERWFKRAAVAGRDPASGGAKKARSMKGRDWVKGVRKQFTDTANSHLEAAGRAERMDPRTLLEQGIDREPGAHRGPVLDGIERRLGESRVKNMREKQGAAVAALIKSPGFAVELGASVREERVKSHWLKRIDPRLEGMVSFAKEPGEDSPELHSRAVESYAQVIVEKSLPRVKKKLAALVVRNRPGRESLSNTTPWADLKTTEIEGARRLLESRNQDGHPDREWIKQQKQLLHAEFEARRRDPRRAAGVATSEIKLSIETTGAGVIRLLEMAGKDGAFGVCKDGLKFGEVARKTPGVEDPNARMAKVAANLQLAMALDKGEQGGREKVLKKYREMGLELVKAGIDVVGVLNAALDEGKTGMERDPRAARMEINATREQFQISPEVARQALAPITDRDVGMER